MNAAQTVKPIQTSYKGYRFRSRLEARWAVFFDALGIAWEYEIEGFQLSDGTCYLPDFWLPRFRGGVFVEVKPTGGDFSTAERFALESHQLTWLAEGTPGFRAYLLGNGDCWWRGVPVIDKDGNGEFGQWCAIPGQINDDSSIPESCLVVWCSGQTFIRAVMHARSTRFEHGECPR